MRTALYERYAKAFCCEIRHPTTAHTMRMICECYQVNFSLKAHNVPCEDFDVPFEVMNEDILKPRHIDEINPYIREYYFTHEAKLRRIVEAINS